MARIGAVAGVSRHRRGGVGHPRLAARRGGAEDEHRSRTPSSRWRPRSPCREGSEAEISLPRQRSGEHGRADLCAHQRLSQALARRHRHAGEGRPAARRDRRPEVDQQLRQAAGGSRRCPGLAGDREGHRRSLARTTADGLGLQAGGGREDQSSKLRPWPKCRPRRRICSGCASCRASRRSLRRSMAWSPARNTDVGQLINAGGGSGPELFRIADMRQLRLYVHVPQAYAGSDAAEPHGGRAVSRSAGLRLQSEARTHVQRAGYLAHVARAADRGQREERVAAGCAMRR